jgi:ABC-2 type transport system permease protein
MSLLRVEVRRLLSRRLFRVLTLLTLLGFAVAGVWAFIDSDDSPQALRRAEQERERLVAECERGFEASPQAEIPEGYSDAGAFCRDQEFVADPRFNYAFMGEIVISVGIPFIMLGWLVGASFVGADWHNRMLTSTLTWEPRRIRLLTTKTLALSIVVFVWMVFLGSALSAALYPAAAFEGITSTVDSEAWRELAISIARVGASTMFAAWLGFALAVVGRNTAAALGVGFVYLAIVENLIRGFRPEWSDWLIGDNLGRFLVGTDSAALLLLAYTVALLVVAAFVFKTREIA